MNLSSYQLGFSTLDQEVNIEMLPVRGTIPSWLKGSLLWTAPAKFEVEGQSYNHWFDGLAMLYKFAFSDGHVSYANRFLHGHSYREASEEDDGIILWVVLDARKGRSFLLILEASGCKELARAEVPHHITFGFHGNYLAETRGPQSFLTLHR